MRQVVAALARRCFGPAAALAAAGLTLGGCVSGTDIDTIQSQLSGVQRQIVQLQQQSSSKEEVAGLDRSLREQTGAVLKSEADVQVAVESLSAQIEALQASLEDTNYRLAQLSQQIAATNQELQAGGGRGGAPSGAPGEGAGGVAASSNDPQGLYQSAYSDYLRGNYDLAVIAFRQYLQAFPETELADNAAYWIGESFFSQGRYRQAIEEFDGILSRYPRSDKRASAMLKKGYALIELGSSTEAAAELERVIREFPQADEANLARQRLDSLGAGATPPPSGPA